MRLPTSGVTLRLALAPGTANRSFSAVEIEIIVPDEIAVMTLLEVAFFPQALMPLHIFEPRYRLMLKTVLASHRIFAIAGLHPNSDPSEERGQRIATAGIVRACNSNPTGTFNELPAWNASRPSRKTPFGLVQIKALASISGATDSANLRLRKRVQRFISLKRQLGAPCPMGLPSFSSR